jgi:hypothetical protein
MISWYRQSLSAHDTHRGHLRRGRVLTACGVEFSPLRTWGTHGSALPGELSDSDQICPECYRRSGLRPPAGALLVEPSPPAPSATPRPGVAFSNRHDHES